MKLRGELSRILQEVIKTYTLLFKFIFICLEIGVMIYGLYVCIDLKYLF
jgi:hypothetical protein